MDIFFILAQITGIIGWIFLVCSYYKEDLDQLLFIQIISSVFYCLNYLFLGAISGLVICLFELIKSIGYYKTDKDDFIFLISLPIYGLIAYFTFDSWIALLPVIGSIIDALTLTKSRKIAVIGGIASNIIWVIYDVLILSLSCAITDGLLVLSNISILLIGYSRLIKSNSIHFLNAPYLTRSCFNRIYSLDKENYDKKYLWETDYQKGIYEKNKDSFTILKENDVVVGYINYLCITDTLFETIKNSKKMINDFSKEDITKYYKSKKNYLIIESICVEKKFQNYKVSKKIKNNIARGIKNKHKKGYNIAGILSFAVSDFERTVLEEAEFKLLKTFDTGETLYILDVDAIKEHYLTKKYIKEEEKSRYKIVTGDNISSEDLEHIYELDQSFYRKKYLWKKPYYLSICEKSLNTLIVLKYNNTLVGYLRYFPISESLYKSIKFSDDLINEFDINEIVRFSKSRNNYLLIKSIIIDSNHQDGYAIKLLTRTLKQNIKKYIRNNYRIKGIIGTSISKESKKFIEQIGFNHFKDLKGTNSVYILENENVKSLFL